MRSLWSRAEFPDTWIPIPAFQTILEHFDSPIHPAAGYYDERRGERKTGQRRPPMVRFEDVELNATTNKLTPAHT